MIFKSSNHLKRFQTCLNFHHIETALNRETEQKNEMSSLDIIIIRQEVNFTTNLHRKLTFSGLYTHFDSSLPVKNWYDSNITL